MLEEKRCICMEMTVTFIRISLACDECIISSVDNDRSHNIAYPSFWIDFDDCIDRDNNGIKNSIFDSASSIELEILLGSEEENNIF